MSGQCGQNVGLYRCMYAGSIMYILVVVGRVGQKATKDLIIYTRDQDGQEDKNCVNAKYVYIQKECKRSTIRVDSIKERRRGADTHRRHHYKTSWLKTRHYPSSYFPWIPLARESGRLQTGTLQPPVLGFFFFSRGLGRPPLAGG